MKVAVRTQRRRGAQRAASRPNTARESTPESIESQIQPEGASVSPSNTLPESHAESQTARDTFHFNSVLAQICLLQLFKYTEGQYSARNSGGHRTVQTGYGWRLFSRLFEHRNAIQSVRLFEHLLRFANDESHTLGRTFFLAYAPLSFEHDDSGEYIGPGVWTPDAGSRTAAVRVRRTLKRWCEWLEALAHFRVHQSLLHSAENRLLDKALIFLWPLHRRNDWLDDELLSLVRGFLGRANGYPCASEAQLISYCRGVLGLRKIKASSVVARSVLPGQAVAERLLSFLPAIQ